MAPNESRRVAAALLIAVAAISFAAIFFRKAAPTHPLVAAGVRLSVAALMLAPVGLSALRRGTLSRRVAGGAVVAGLFYAVHFGAWVSSLTLTSVAASVTLVTATPLLLGIASLVTGRDRPETRHWAAIGLAAVGLAVIGGHDLSLSAGRVVGDALALLGALAMAAYLLVARRLGDTMPVVAFSGIATAVGGAALLLTCAVLGVPIHVASGEAFLFLVLAAIVPQIIGHSLLTWALRHARPTVVGIATVGEPVGATALGWLVLGERLALLTGVGCAITLCAVGLAVWGPTGRRRRR